MQLAKFIRTSTSPVVWAMSCGGIHVANVTLNNGELAAAPVAGELTLDELQAVASFAEFRRARAGFKRRDDSLDFLERLHGLEDPR